MPYTKVLPWTVFTSLRKNGLGYTSWTTSLPGVRTGQSLPGWRKVIKASGNATTPFSTSRYQINEFRDGAISYVMGFKDGIGPGQDSFLAETWTGFANGGQLAFDHLPGSSFTSADNKALTGLYRRIRAEHTNMNGLQFLGELRESLHMIRHPADALVKEVQAYSSLLSKRKKGIRPGLPLKEKVNAWKRIVSGTWLEVSFGWKPLLMDTKDIAETAARAILKDDRRTRVRYAASGDPLHIHHSELQFVGNAQYFLITNNDETITTPTVQYIVGMKQNVLGPVNQLDRVRDLCGFSVENFVPTIWELMPYSFLVDYFTNIGEIIEASTTCMSDVTWMSKTELLKTKHNVWSRAPDMVNPGGNAYRASIVGTELGTFEGTKSTVTRTLPSSLGIPTLELSLPGTTTRYANIAALIAGARPRNQSFF